MNHHHAAFELWRQDDNGNRFLVGTFDDRAAAERQLTALTRVQHKQIYWIAECQIMKPQETPCR
ncbi:hypothetical protein KI811_05205 [Geobacter hydrogenophilus]|uniref:SPOR domain-containing protein n=1 Tax=Geobacter hydrogenophilus TaxID=40983 RepID=A0A9W6G167_9BACT|nr:hypothetical protein [Geobacter hydrogenophilus]MBT0893211.1 hypothetical protein [Geobacter hydrogenophilus]GLI38944.1 hypothetical protein GHYDROH2_24450 [Geobacter hydrogenophilus]